MPEKASEILTSITKVNDFLTKSKVNRDSVIVIFEQIFSFCAEIFINSYAAYLSIKNSQK